MVSKDLWVAFVLSKLPFFWAFGQDSHNGAKVFDKPAVERGQPMEILHFCDGGENTPTFNSLNFRFINLNSLTGHNIPRKTTSQAWHITFVVSTLETLEKDALHETFHHD